MKADRELFVLNSEIYNKFNVNVGDRSVLFVTRVHVTSYTKGRRRVTCDVPVATRVIGSLI